MTPYPDPYADQAEKQKKLMIWGAVGAVVLLLLGVGIGVLAARKGPDTAVLVKPEKPAPPVMAAKADPAPPVLPADNAMPKDVLDWLEHLRKTDAESATAARGLVGPLLKMAVINPTTMGLSQEQMFGEDGPAVEKPPTQNLEKEVEKNRTEWARIRDFYHQLPPPAECAAIAAEYETVVSEKELMTTEIMKKVQDASTDPQGAIDALTKSYGTSSTRIDAAAKRADALVQQICDKYKTRKWFSLDADPLGGLMPSVGGMSQGVGLPNAGTSK
jgi:hypothetical protein